MDMATTTHKLFNQQLFNQISLIALITETHVKLITQLPTSCIEASIFLEHIVL